ncbi:MAG TPA: hypothetical protein VGN17_13255 [Bryobacteraceae bacterium]|jgi:hypothetical protein
MKPPKFAEAVVRWVLPPSCVEHVLGDLQERIQGLDPRVARRQYVLDALVTVPAAIAGRINFDLRLVALYLAVQYAAFAVFAQLSSESRHLLATPKAWVEIGWFAAGAVAVRLIEDAYRPASRLYRFFAALAWIGAAVWLQGLALGLGWGYLAYTRFLDLARDYYGKRFAGPEDQRTS